MKCTGSKLKDFSSMLLFLFFLLINLCCSDVRQYHIAADTTMESSTKRKFDDSYGEQKAKRIKVEEVEEAAGMYLSTFFV